MQANRLEFEQGSQAWLSFRKGKISASKVAAILGVSPYLTPLQIYETEMGLRDPQASSPHMQRGLDVEDQVRQWFYETTRILVKPCVVQHPTNPLFIASLDGMSDNGETIVEIKNNNETYHQNAKNGIIVDFHHAQMQMQMYVTGLESCHYVSHRQGDYAHVVVKRDNEFITDMVVKLLDFKRRLDDFDPPAPTDRDYEDMSNDSGLKSLMLEYKDCIEESKYQIEKSDKLKKQMLERIGDKNAKGANWKVTRYSRLGNVDYEAILDKHNIDVDVDEYRKKGSVSYRITVE